MDVYHQTGHNSVWNRESLIEDSAGSGIIFSPVNDSSDKILALSEDVKKISFFDPQLYLPKSQKKKLATFDYFPSNFAKNFQTSDFDREKNEIAKRCIDFQLANQFRYVVIPTRYYDVIPSDFFEQFEDHLVAPFLRYYQGTKTQNEILLTIIVKQEQLMNDEHRDELLNWLTDIQDIDGVYLIFENNFLSKQIKDSGYIYNILIFIHSLKLNQLEVHVGYSNIDGIIYSIADANSISMGSYDNLRKFNAKRFDDKNQGPPRGPNARLYCRELFQFLDYGYKDGIINLYSRWSKIFENSRYRPLMFKPNYNWHFSKPEPYKHYFLLFSSQIRNLPPSIKDRITVLKDSFQTAGKVFKEIELAGVYLNDDNDGSHLPFWLTAISMFEKYLKDNSYEI